MRKTFARKRHTWPTALALVCAVPFAVAPPFSTPLAAQSQRDFNVPAGRLSSSIRTLARQAGISIASRDSGIRRVRVKAVKGRMSVSEALRRMLAGTPYRAVAVRGGYRIERRPVVRRTPRATPAPAPPPPPAAPARVVRPAPPPPPPAPPIIVEGSKRSQSEFTYPGGVKVIDLAADGEFAAGSSLDQALADIPSVSGTALGSGRNKIFLRGIADSSFNGPTQSTIGLYLGEQRLTFSAPNPDLKLYDVDTVELLEGPQGTLYGAGTIAGLVRANPRRPDPSGVEAEGWAGVGITQGGGPSWDLGAAGNLPVSDTAALRFLAYSGQSGGYIDDLSRNQTDINRHDVFGGRAAFSADLSSDWNVELSGFIQHGEYLDGQYTEDRRPDLTRANLIAQPFLGRIYGGSATVRGYLGDIELVSNTGLVDHYLSTVFDSSSLTDDGDGELGRQAFRETRKIRLLSHETRLSGGDPDGFAWVAGVSALRNRDNMEQLITNLNGSNPPPFAQLTYHLDEVAAFGEGSYRFAPEWTLTAGSRLLYTRASGERSFGATTVVEPREGLARMLPAVALSWRPSEQWHTYLRYQQGFRTGGVTIERDENGDPATALFDPDRVASYEAGIRARLGDATPIELTLTLHHADWRDIQADLLDLRGFPITRNIGDGTIVGIDGSVRVATPTGWALSVAGAWNQSEADRLLADGSVRNAPIPNVPDFSVSGRIAKSWELENSDNLGLSLSGSYVGSSFLDIDQQVSTKQGNYGSVDLAAWWERERFDLRIEALNLTNTEGNRFAFGNPFTARFEPQSTPLRPLTVRAVLTVRH